MGIEYLGKCLLITENAEKILAVGDLHLGYEEALFMSGISVGRVLFAEIIDEFKEVFAKTGKVDRIVLLGDVKHVFSLNLKQEWNDVLALFDFLLSYCKEIIVTRGNHDNYLMTIAGKRMVRVVDSFVFGETAFLHGNKEYKEIGSLGIKRWIMGHGHPAIKISDGKKTEKYKCFLVGKYGKREIIIVPSFFGANEGSDVRNYDMKMAWDFGLSNFDVRIVSNNLEVLNFGRLSKIK